MKVSILITWPSYPMGVTFKRKSLVEKVKKTSSTVNNPQNRQAALAQDSLLPTYVHACLQLPVSFCTQNSEHYPVDEKIYWTSFIEKKNSVDDVVSHCWLHCQGVRKENGNFQYISQFKRFFLSLSLMNCDLCCDIPFACRYSNLSTPSFSGYTRRNVKESLFVK